MVSLNQGGAGWRGAAANPEIGESRQGFGRPLRRIAATARKRGWRFRSQGGRAPKADGVRNDVSTVTTLVEERDGLLGLPIPVGYRRYRTRPDSERLGRAQPWGHAAVRDERIAWLGAFLFKWRFRLYQDYESDEREDLPRLNGFEVRPSSCWPIRGGKNSGKSR